MISQEEYEKIKDSSPFIQWISKKDKELLLSQSQLFFYEAGQILMNADESYCDKFFILVEGSIKVSKISLEGREVVLYRLGKGEICIINASCILSERVYSATAVIESPSLVLGIPSYIVTEILIDYPDFHQLLYSSLLLKMDELVMKFEDVTFKSINDRVLDFLNKKREVEKTSHFTMTHEELAYEIGSVREVVSRSLKSLEKSKHLKLQRGKISLL